MKVLFLGSSSFSNFVLDSILKSKHSICAVVTQPDRPSGRGQKLCPTPVKEFALKNNLKVLEFEKISRNMDVIKELDYDIAIVASFGQILNQEFLDNKLCINVHPSLLPKYRGSTPVQSAILNGDSVTGVTIMKVAKAVDAGDIILQSKIEILPDEKYENLIDRLFTLGGQMAVEAIELVESGKVTFTKQDESKAGHVKMLEKNDGFLNFALGAESVYNRYRALSECLGCYFYIGDNKIKVGDLKIIDEQGTKNAIISCKKRLIIGCGDKCIEILACQAPNGKMLDANFFLNGFRFSASEVNTCLPI